MTTFIKDLELANRLTPDFADAFEEFVPVWLQHLIPFYQEAKSKGDDILELVNYKPMGAECELYESNGIGYYRHKSSGLSMLGFNSDYKYQRVNWYECFRNFRPDVDEDETKRICNFSIYNAYFSRIFNTKPPYNELAKRVDAYFKTITGDSEVGFSLGRTSYIYFNKKGKDYIYLHHMLD